MTPYYADDLVTIYHGDAREIRPAADVIVTDPPYGTGAYPTDTAALSPAMVQRWTDEFRSVAIFGWPEALVALCMASGRAPDEWIVWWPSNAMLKGRAAPGIPREAEHIAIFGYTRTVHGAPHTANGSALLARHIPTGVNSRGRAHVDPAGKRWGDVWTDAAPGLAFQSKHRQHPNEKSLDVMARLVQMVDDGTVLDPFAGSGTTLVAAKSLGRRAVGIEIEERYCEIAATRCSQDVLGLEPDNFWHTATSDISDLAMDVTDEEADAFLAALGLAV